MNQALFDTPRSWRTNLANASSFNRVGLTAVAVLAFWPLLNGGWRTSVLIVVCAGAFAVGRHQASINASIVLAFLVFGLAMVAAIDLGGLLSNGAGRGPFGYANAKAALFVQGSAAGVMLAMTAGSTMVRRLALGAAAGFAVVPLVSSTVAATLTLGLVAGGAVASRRLTRPLIGSFMALFAAALIATTIVGIAGELPGGSTGGRRVALWSEAVDMLGHNPLVGGGAFSETSPTAASDADASWVHNEFLQLGAEHGLPAMAAAVVLVMWLLVRLRRAAVMSRLAAPAAGAVAALSVHACVDYLGHFALIPMFCAALAGTALGVSETRSTDVRSVPPLRSTPV